MVPGAHSADARAASPWRHVPNVISALRIVLVVPVAVAIVTHHYRLALGLAALAGISDALDGWLARHFDWGSRLGSILDPLADKLLLATSFVVLAVVGRTSWSLVALVLARDAVISVGALAWQRVLGHFQARPSLVSKCCTTAQILYVLVLLFVAAGWLDWSPRPWAWAVLLFTLASGLDYVLRWGRRARVELARKRGGTHDAS